MTLHEGKLGALDFKSCLLLQHSTRARVRTKLIRTDIDGFALFGRPFFA